ncbi:MAG: serine hydrolase domain-containing protein [Myxococcota bacterium]
MKRALATVVLGLLSITACKAAGSPAVRAAVAESLPASYDELAARLDATVPELLEQSGASSISIAVVDGQRLVYRRSFGVADKEHARPATPDTRYEIGSISKPFVGLVVMQMVEAGALELDAPITDYLPEFSIQSRFEGEAVPTLRTLLTHRAGLPSDLSTVLDAPDYEIAQLPEILRREWLTHAPGQAIIYSSVGIDLAALVAQRVSGREYSELVEGEVLEPLGMHTASARGSGDDPTLEARGHDEVGNAVPDINFSPCGSIRASATEMAQLVKWVNGRGRVDGHALLSREGVEEMMRVQNADAPLDLGAQVGLSWFINKGSEATGDVLEHEGATAGFVSQLSVLPKHGLGVVVLGNDRKRLGYELADNALMLALHAKTGLDLRVELAATSPVPPPPNVALTAEQLDRLAQTVYSDGNNVFVFEHRRGALRADLRGRDRLSLTPRADGTFEMKGYLFGVSTGALMPGYRASFETLDGKQVIVARGSRGAFVMAARFVPGQPGRAWRERVGTYRPSEPDKSAIEEIRVSIEDGALFAEADLQGQDEPVHFVFEVYSDEVASIAGHGRRSGAALVAQAREGKTILRSQGLEFVSVDR